MLSSSSAGTIPSPRDRINGFQNHAQDSNSTTRPELEPSTPILSSSRSRVFDRLKPWRTSTSTSIAGRRKSTLFSSKKGDDPVAGDPYVEQAVANNAGPGASPRKSEDGVGDGDGYEWEEGSEDEAEVDAYSWIDPSIIGTSALGHSSTPEEEVRSPGVASRLLQGPLSPVATQEPPHDPDRPILHPAASYNMLLAYQSTTSSKSASRHPSHRIPRPPPPPPSETGHKSQDSSQWHEFVDRSMIPSLGKHETQRQGLWFEVIHGEMEYVKDLKMLCDDFIAPLRTQQPAVISPEGRMEAFVREVFSTTQTLAEGHTRMLDRLLERQRQEWPLLTSAADILLNGFFEMAELYEKNYPFSDARVKRERDQNPSFRLFLNDRNNAELTQRRDVFVLLSRPMTRLPRIMLQLTTALQYTPEDHPDHDGIPALTDSISRIIKGSQPGIESAESKIKLWNVAEKLLFKRGEIIELDISDGKRTLVHEGYVFRRIRSETNWHGWQDLRMILLDNYMLLTRDEEQGRLVVVSRPIHLDFLQIVTADGQPERRHDNLATRWRSNGVSDGNEPERLMYPFTISTSGGPNARTYTLCTATQSARNTWREKIQGAKTIRHFDLESNKLFAMHPIKAPPAIRAPISSAELFTWRGRETIAIASGSSVFVGWRHDSSSIRELIRLPGAPISSIAVVSDFGWILVIQGGKLVSFNLNQMIPTSDTSTWLMAGKLQAVKMSPAEHNVSFVRIGYTKDRLMVAYAALTNNSTIISYYEPLVVYDTNNGFRHFATTIIPGIATEISFFKQTVAIVTEKTIIIAEPGNSTSNQIPSFPAHLNSSVLRRMMDSTKVKPLGMYQTSENEFLLVYQWGACFVTKFGEISRSGLYLRWNLAPTYSIYKAPCLLLFDESTGQVEVRDITNGKMCEVLGEKGLRALRKSKRDGEVLALGTAGLVEIKETVPL